MSSVCFWTQADFLDFDLCLGFPGFAFLLCFFVDELAKVHDTTNRGGGTGGDLYKIHLGITGNLQGLTNRHDTDIATIWPDQANFRDADALIYTKFVGADMLLLFNYETNPAICGWFFSGANDTMKAYDSSIK